jgi:hypothetical protein
MQPNALIFARAVKTMHRILRLSKPSENRTDFVSHELFS